MIVSVSETLIVIVTAVSKSVTYIGLVYKDYILSVKPGGLVT